MKRSLVQIPNNTAKDDTEMTAALAVVQPDDKFHTPKHANAYTQKYEHYTLHTNR